MSRQTWATSQYGKSKTEGETYIDTKPPVK